MKVLIFGRGYIGKYFDKYFTENGIEHNLSDKFITLPEQIEKEINSYKPTHVLNCIGETGKPNIDWCETHKLDTYFTNTTIPKWLAEICNKKKIHFTHLSSGCIFDSTKNMKVYTEEDKPNDRRSYYNITKIEAENKIKKFNPLIIRLRIPISLDNSEKCLITKIKKFKKLVDFPNSVTTLPLLLNATTELMKRNRTGVYHVVNRGFENHIIVWNMLKDRECLKGKKIAITPDELNSLTIAKRGNTLLSTEKLEKEGIIPEDIYTYLKEHIRRIEDRPKMIYWGD